MNRVVLTLLAIDGVISALLGAFFLPVHVGTVPFPLSAVLSGAANAGFVWAATHWTSSNGVALLPLWTWLATVVVLTVGGPGGDVVFGGPGVFAYGVLLFVLAGTLPAAWVISRRSSRG